MTSSANFKIVSCLYKRETFLLIVSCISIGKASHLYISVIQSVKPYTVRTIVRLENITIFITSFIPKLSCHLGHPITKRKSKE